MRTGRRRDLPEAGAPLARPLNLIHTTNSPNPCSTRAPARLMLSIHDPDGLPIGDTFRLLRGDLSPLEYLLLRRAANASTKST